MTALHLRPAMLADMPAVGAMQHAVWRDAYRGVLDEALLEQLTPEGMAGYHARHFDEAAAPPVPRNPLTAFFVVQELAKGATAPTLMLGMCRGGPTRAVSATGDPFPGWIAEKYPFELYAIHVATGTQRKGVGRALFAAMAGVARAQGHDSLMLWVLRDNAVGRGFYDRLGGTPVGESVLTLGGRGYPQLAYAWEGLGAFE